MTSARWGGTLLVESRIRAPRTPNEGVDDERRDAAGIAAMAETYDVTMAPHRPLGPVSPGSSLQPALAEW
ncbi:hypothetical protein [Nonomuraea indica]|uniref:hypothetical protein n=1 Tax=Nonomuraea indica TaxID=1581193 RepID=UPI000C79FF0B|nr:hypothetical protein [Nonomuraea indica]